MDFRSKSVVITGASTGIGEGLAVALAGRGAKLTLGARNLEELERVAERCRAAGGEAQAVVVDVAESAACERLVAAAAERFGGIDAMVCNAGITMTQRFDEISDLSLFERIMRVNYLGTVYCVHFALPYLKRSRGLVVAVSSLTGKTGVPTRTGYSASKHAVQGFCDSLRIEVAPGGVDVLVVSPGFVRTAIRERAAGSTQHGASPAARGMSVEECARQIAEAMERRRRELVMTAGGRVLQWIRLVAPSVVDRIAERTVRSQAEAEKG